MNQTVIRIFAGFRKRVFPRFVLRERRRAERTVDRGNGVPLVVLVQETDRRSNFRSERLWRVLRVYDGDLGSRDRGDVRRQRGRRRVPRCIKSGTAGSGECRNREKRDLPEARDARKIMKLHDFLQRNDKRDSSEFPVRWR